ncbi:MAG: AbrB/MazE/SpoVT family DNA-binding domain-containing protein [Terriglobales bacterium]
MATSKVQLVKWGNSHAVRIPKTMLDRIEIRPGDELEIRVEEGRIELRPAARRLTLRALVSRITPGNRHTEVDWGKPAGREVW